MSRGNENGREKKKITSATHTPHKAQHRTAHMKYLSEYERGQENRHRRLIKERRKTRVNCVVFGWRHLKCSNDTGDDDDCGGGAADGGVVV